MDKLRIAVLGPSEIATRRTIPAMLKSDKVEYAGVAAADPYEWSENGADPAIIEGVRAKCNELAAKFGGKVFLSYKEAMESTDVDAVYIPLPPGIHFKWTEEALKRGKHVLTEKPFTTSLDDSNALIALAKEKGLALHENYAFAFHKQIDELEKIVREGQIGELRFVRAAFSFPYRGESDFRYHKAIGGGALIDCGGYPVRLANRLLGGNAKVETASMLSARDHDVDVFGSATLSGENGITAQVFWGMDDAYKCDVEIFGSTGTVSTGRVYSPPAELKTKLVLTGAEVPEIELEGDDQFMHSVEYFADCVQNGELREQSYDNIYNQARIIEEIRRKCSND